MDTITSPDIEALASRVQLCKKKVADYKRGFLLGHLAYEDLAEAGRELSDALFEYSRIKFPDVKPRRLPYQSIYAKPRSSVARAKCRAPLIIIAAQRVAHLAERV